MPGNVLQRPGGEIRRRFGGRHIFEQAEDFFNRGQTFIRNRLRQRDHRGAGAAIRCSTVNRGEDPIEHEINRGTIRFIQFSRHAVPLTLRI